MNFEAAREAAGQRLHELRATLAATDTLVSSLRDGPGLDSGTARLALRQATEPGAVLPLVGGPSMASRLDGLGGALKALPPGQLGPAAVPSTARVGIVADRFAFTSFKGLADVVEVTPSNYRTRLDVDVLLVVTAWAGRDGANWSGVASEDSRRRRQLTEEVMPSFRKAGIPVVFYSIEDPPNYERFLGIARHADIVFTSAEEKLPDYRRDCPDASHYGVLPFGVNPLHHSPIGSRPGQSDLVYFAGSWLPEKYPDRTAQGRVLFDGVLEAGRKLCLIDRNSALEGKDPRYAFPPEYAPYLAAARSHRELMRLQRISDIAINLNSVVDSQTMFANRALELQASGTVVLSNYNMGLNSNYPQVHLANSVHDVATALESMTFAQMRRIQADGIRKVFTDDLALHRLDTILEAAGIAAPDRRTTAVAVATEPTEALRAEFARQTHGPIEVLTPEQYASGQSTADIVLPVDAGLRYSADYVADFAAAFTYADARVVAKTVHGPELADETSHRFLDTVPETHASAWWARGSGAPVGFTRTGGEGIYGLDAMSVSVRPSAPIEVAAPRPPAELAVVVPVYNNGSHLRHKCFASLLRSSVFRKMHIILVDDGSSDPQTLDTIAELVEEYPNVSSHAFPEGGSGSASRPRNKGLELADTEFVTYLDPDNEAVEDGYALLLARLKDTDADFAIGNMTRWSDRRKTTNYVKILRASLDKDEDGLLLAGPDALRRTGFQPMSIQALVARTAWLRQLGLEQPVGAVGQDSYFFQQMLHYARKIVAEKRNIHTYYSAVSMSTVNTVNARLFRKYQPLEAARSQWLRQEGLLESYNQLRLEPFVRDWYLRKFASVPEDQRAEAAETLVGLVSLFGRTDWTDPVVAGFWNTYA